MIGDVLNKVRGYQDSFEETKAGKIFLKAGNSLPAVNKGLGKASLVLTLAAPALATSADTSIDAAMGGILGIFFTVLRWVGVASVLFGVYKMVQGQRGENSDKVSSGIGEVVAGLVMVFIKPLIAAIPGMPKF